MQDASRCDRYHQTYKPTNHTITIWKCALQINVIANGYPNEFPNIYRLLLNNKLTKPIANNIAGVNLMLPRHKVVSQLNTLMAEGTAMSNVSNTNIDPEGIRHSQT